MSVNRDIYHKINALQGYGDVQSFFKVHQGKLSSITYQTTRAIRHTGEAMTTNQLYTADILHIIKSAIGSGEQGIKTFSLSYTPGKLTHLTVTDYDTTKYEKPLHEAFSFGIEELEQPTGHSRGETNTSSSSGKKEQD